MIVKYLVNVLVSSLLSILIQQVSDFVGFSLLCIAVAAAECSRIASGACCLEELGAKQPAVWSQLALTWGSRFPSAMAHA